MKNMVFDMTNIVAAGLVTDDSQLTCICLIV